MHLISLNGKQFGIPEKANEIKVSQFVDFIKQKEKTVLTGNLVEDTVSFAKILSEYWRVPLEELSDMEVDIDQYDIGSQEYNSVASLVARINKVIEAYKPNMDMMDSTFVYQKDGSVWTIPKFKVSQFTKDHIRPPLKLGPFLKISEAKRVADLSIGKKDKNGNDLDPNGSVKFSEIKYIVAYLATNEDLDKGMTIDEKIMYFDDIDFETGMNLFFFLMDIASHSGTTTDLNSFLTHLN